ncbi:hypothetical protein J6590_026809 [Homalodisca vitripennis]|nr:hypothetical protein J6590_026809 [Homalodisca vitripennis]
MKFNCHNKLLARRRDHESKADSAYQPVMSHELLNMYGTGLHKPTSNCKGAVRPVAARCVTLLALSDCTVTCAIQLKIDRNRQRYKDQRKGVGQRAAIVLLPLTERARIGAGYWDDDNDNDSYLLTVTDIPLITLLIVLLLITEPLTDSTPPLSMTSVSGKALLWLFVSFRISDTTHEEASISCRTPN